MKNTFRFLCLSVSILFIAAAGACSEKETNSPQTAPAEIPSHRPMPNVDSLVRTCPRILNVSSSSTVELAPGVNETDMSITIKASQEGETGPFVQKINIVAIDSQAEGLKIRTVAPKNIQETPSGSWPRQTLSQMAANIDSPSSRVISMINADFFASNEGIIAPVGVLHTEGIMLKTTFEPRYKKQGISWVGVNKANAMSIEPSSQYRILPNITGAGIILMYGGKDLDNSKCNEKGRHPRTGIAYTSDQFIYFFVVDGRSSASAGMTMDDMGAIFASLKCEAAVNLDGGGSSEILSRDPADKTLKIRNTPSDGSERQVIDAWCVVIDETIKEQ